MKLTSEFLAAASIALLPGAGIQVRAAEPSIAARRPNILWITAENMGPDLGCYPDSPWSKQVRTPHLDQLAREGLRYRLAFDTSPGCSPSRSAFMTGMYQTTIGAHNHRSHRHDHFRLPEGVRPITHRLAEAGYFTGNIISMDGKRVGTGKTDLNFEVTGPVLYPDLVRSPPPTPRDSGIDATVQNDRNFVRLYHSSEWTNLKSRQPFFAQINLPVVERTVRGTVYGWTGSSATPAFGTQAHPAQIDPASVIVPPYYPEHPITRNDWAGYLDAVCDVDMRVGEILARLSADGLADDTIVIFFADNGRLEARGHHWCYDSGERVPFIMRWPANFPAPPDYRAGAVSDRLISLLDLTATTLSFAGVTKPAGMQSEIFSGAAAGLARTYAFSSRDRCNEVVTRIRSVRNARYRYNRNFTPEVSFSALSRYKEASYPVMPLLRQLHAEGRLTPTQAALMAPRLPEEELYDLENDPFEIVNLAASAAPGVQRVRKELSGALEQWIAASNDQGRTPEPADELRQWVGRAHDQYGTPSWAQGSAGATADAPLVLAATLRDESALAGAHDIEIRDGLAYIAGKGFTRRGPPRGGAYPYEAHKGGSLAIVDVRHPQAPKLMWHARDPLAYEDAETVLPLSGNRLLVGARDLFLFDVSDSTRPRQLGVIKDRTRVDTINGFARLGDTVFAANKQGQILAVDIATPDAISLLGARDARASGELGLPHDAALSGDLLVVASPEGFGTGGRPGILAVYRVADSRTRQALPAEKWSLLGKLEHPRLAGANRVLTRGVFAYVGSSLTTGNVERTDSLRANVSVIDISDPAAPTLRSCFEFSHSRDGSNGLEIAGEVVFAAGGQTVQAVDVSNPDAPRELAHFTSAEAFPGGKDDAHDLVYLDGHLFVTAQNSHALVILKMSDALRRRIK